MIINNTSNVSTETSCKLFAAQLRELVGVGAAMSFVRNAVIESEGDMHALKVALSNAIIEANEAKRNHIDAALALHRPEFNLSLDKFIKRNVIELAVLSRKENKTQYDIDRIASLKKTNASYRKN